MGNAHRVYWLRFHESRRSSSHAPDSLNACAPATKARNAGAALERHPDTIGVRERAHSPLPDAVSHARWGARMVDLEFQPKRACLRSNLRAMLRAKRPAHHEDQRDSELALPCVCTSLALHFCEARERSEHSGNSVFVEAYDHRTQRKTKGK